jgi:hypothetical protein
MAASVASANIGDMLGVNKFLRFAKETANTHLFIRLLMLS